MPETISAIASRAAALSATDRTLLVTPGLHGIQFPELDNAFPLAHFFYLDSSPARLQAIACDKLSLVRATATRLPFKRHSFEAVLSIESLFAIRPPWTVLAEFHRVLVPDGKLILIEPQSLGFFSSLRDKISGPGKRVFPLDEIKFRLARADYSVDSVETHEKLSGFSRPAYCIRAIKKENPAEPVPQFLTAKEMMERRKKGHPAGEELP